MIFSNAIAALLLASPMVSAQRFRLTQKGCLLDKADGVAAKIKCGKRSAVTFAVEWYGGDVQELQSWLGVAGCSEQEAMAEARRAVEHCLPTKLEHNNNVELRELAKDSGYIAKKRSVRLGRRALNVLDDEELAERADDDTDEDADDNTDDDTDDDSDSETTSTSTSSTTLSTSTTPNTWTLLQLTTISNKNVTLTKTCATTSSFTTSVCSSSHDSSSCTTFPTETMACLEPFVCSFATDTGAFQCYEKTGMQWYGWLVAGILAIAVAFLASAVTFKCCRESKSQRRSAAAAAVALEPLCKGGSMEKSFGKGGAGVVSVRELGVGGRDGGTVPPTPVSVRDAVAMPLMAPEFEYPPEPETPRYVPYGQTPGVVVHRGDDQPGLY